jgi:hypothetical protein
MAYTIIFPHHLEIDGVPLSTPAWEHLNLQLLYSLASTRGENRVMPGAAGRRALPWRADETMRTLTMIVTGNHHWDGTANADPIAGLWANVAHLVTNVGGYPATPDGTRTAVIKRPGAPDRVATIQVRGFEVTEDQYSPAAVGLSIDIAVLDGAFA